MKKNLSYPLLVSFSLFLTLTGYSQQNKNTHQVSDFSGSTEVIDVYSPALEGNLQGNPSTEPVKVYLPPNYEEFPDNKYPVVYLLHQFTTDYDAYFSMYGIVEKLDRLISNKTIRPMIIATPNTHTIYDGCGFTNSYVSGNWEDYITSDVFQHIENNYAAIEQPASKGLAGFSSAGYGTLNIAMKHPSKMGAIGIIAAAIHLEEGLLNDPSWITEAAEINEFRPYDPWYIHAQYSWAVDFAPDSTAKPILGRLPYTAEGVLIDSTWQEWVEHFPLTMLEIYDDSLKKLNAIQLFIGNQDDLVGSSNEILHQALTDKSINHGYDTYNGGHNPEPVLEDLLIYFSESLVSVVPAVRSLSEDYLNADDSLVLISDMDGSVFIVSDTVYPAIDSIIKYQLTTIDIIAGEEKEVDLSDFEIGYYHVYAVSNENMVSNIPVKFCLVPDKSPPALDLLNDRVARGDSIRVSLSRDGTVCLVGPAVGMDTFLTVSEILASSRLKSSVYVPAGEEAAFSTSSLAKTTYWIYGYDQYGIVSAPVSVEIVEPAAIMAEKQPEIELYPNPAFETVMLQVNITQPYDLIITSLNGQQVYSRKIESAHHQLDLSSFQKGVYFITIRSTDFITTRKIIKL